MYSLKTEILTSAFKSSIKFSKVIYAKISTFNFDLEVNKRHPAQHLHDVTILFIRKVSQNAASVFTLELGKLLQSLDVALLAQEVLDVVFVDVR